MLCVLEVHSTEGTHYIRCSAVKVQSTEGTEYNRYIVQNVQSAESGVGQVWVTGIDGVNVVWMNSEETVGK